MNRKQLALLVVVLVVLGGIGILIQSNRNKNSDTGEAGVGQKLLGENFPINDVTHIVIKGATNELNLAKKNDRWCVAERGDYPASFGQISDFLIKASALKVVQSEEIGASQLPRMRLVRPGQGTNSGTLLELRGKDEKAIRTVLLGKKHSRKPQGEAMPFGGDEGMADGRYVMTGNEKTRALLIGDPLNNAEPNAATWLDKDFFKIEKPKSIEVTFPTAATNSWKLTRDNEAGDWKLADAKKDEKLDSGKSSGVTTPFASPSFNDIVFPAGKPEENGLDKPTIVKVETFDDFVYTIKIGKKAGEDYPITVAVTANFPKEPEVSKDEKPEQKAKADKMWQDHQKLLDDKLKHEKTFESWTYLVPGWSVDQTLKERKDLLEEKKDDKKDSRAAPADDNKADLTPSGPLDAPNPGKNP